MGEDSGEILRAIGALDVKLSAVQTTATDTQETVKALEERMTAVQIKNAVQDNDIVALKSECANNTGKINAAFKKIEAHINGHALYYGGTVGIVISILTAWKLISG